MTISPKVEKLIEEYKRWQKEQEIHEEEGVISVDEVAARVASFYEKIRGIVDWREEHLLRKTAIERILKRRLAISGFSEDFAEHFLSELVRGGHFPNNRISFDKVDEIQGILEKYVAIIEHHRTLRERNKNGNEDWLLGVAAAETEEALSLPRRERGLISLMAQDLEERTTLSSRKKPGTHKLSPTEKMLQVSVAVERALFKLDNATITYHIFEASYEDWKNLRPETLRHIAENLERLRQGMNGILQHPYGERFYQLAEKYDTPYLILGDILAEEADRFFELVQNPALLEDAIRQAYDHRLGRLKGKMKRAAFYGTLSVFITKILVALAVEIPLEQQFAGELNYVALGLNIAIPPLLMIGLVSTVQTTSAQNFQRVMVEVMRIIQPRARQDPYKIFPPRKRTGFIAAVVYGIYALSFLVSFGALVWILNTLHFSILSTFIFIMFISLVLFGGTRIRHRGRELMVEAPKEGFLYNIFDLFSLPMIQVGRWLSSQLVRYNVLVVVLNFLIEVPFQMFVELLEQWRGFLREKKEEIH